MKRISKGKKKIKEFKFKCDECESQFLISKEDCGKRVSDFRDGDYYYFKCPDCGSREAVDASLLE